MKKFIKVAAVAGLCLAVHAPASAFRLVLDKAVLAQAVLQVESLAKQYENMQLQLAAMTGDRGMSGLLANQNRNYLPPEWNAAMTVLNSAAGTRYSELSRIAMQIKSAQQVLSQQEAGNLSPQMQQYLEQVRNLSASQQAIGQQAYRTAAERVNVLQTLTNALRGQNDPKAVMDLQARIASEQAALANDQAQLQSVAQLTAAQGAAQEAMTNELRAQSSGTLDMLRLNINTPR